MYPVRRMFGFGRIKGEEREREKSERDKSDGRFRLAHPVEWLGARQLDTFL